MEHRFSKYIPQGLVMVAIDPNADDYVLQGEVANFVDTLGVSYPVGVEEPTHPRYSEFTAAFKGVNPYPVDVLVDKQGKIRYVAREYDPVAIDALIQQLLAE
jgi:hypothetical protein